MGIDISQATVLVTGANRGIGEAFVEALLPAGVKRLYAAARDEANLAGIAGNERLSTLSLDVTRPDQVAAAARRCADVDLLINNAGINRNRPLIGEPDAIAIAREEIEVNYLGTLSMCRAFAPVLAANGGGTIVNMLSALSLMNLPAIGSYCVSKAAGLSMTQGVRAELAAQGTRVIAAMPGAVDTRLSPGSKSKPADVVAEILTALAGDEEDLFPNAEARGLAEGFAADRKALEKQMAQVLPG